MDRHVIEALSHFNKENDAKKIKDPKEEQEAQPDFFNQAAVATIISTLGSSPRKAGAQVLFFRDGRVIGTIGGGCGEAEVRQQAFRVLEHGKPIVVDVNLTHEAAEDDGMVCGGVMKVYIEPALYDPEECRATHEQ